MWNPASPSQPIPTRSPPGDRDRCTRVLGPPSREDCGSPPHVSVALSGAAVGCRWLLPSGGHNRAEHGEQVDDGHDHQRKARRSLRGRPTAKETALLAGLLTAEPAAHRAAPRRDRRRR
jgi:hypothetical protein